MKTLDNSRGPSIDTEKCVAQIGNLFDMVLIGAVRAREIRRQQGHSTQRKHIFPVVTALEDIQSGKVDKSYILRVK